MRVIVTLTVVVVVLAASVAVATAHHTRAYNDVPPSKSYSEAVEWSAEEGIMAGCSRTRFCPTKYATRWMVVEALHNHHRVLVRDIQDAVAEVVPDPHAHPLAECIAERVVRTPYGDQDGVTAAVHDCTRLLSKHLPGW